MTATHAARLQQEVHFRLFYRTVTGVYTKDRYAPLTKVCQQPVPVWLELRRIMGHHPIPLHGAFPYDVIIRMQVHNYVGTEHRIHIVEVHAVQHLKLLIGHESLIMEIPVIDIGRKHTGFIKIRTGICCTFMPDQFLPHKLGHLVQLIVVRILVRILKKQLKYGILRLGTHGKSGFGKLPQKRCLA